MPRLLSFVQVNATSVWLVADPINPAPSAIFNAAVVCIRSLGAGQSPNISVGRDADVDTLRFRQLEGVKGDCELRMVS